MRILAVAALRHLLRSRGSQGSRRLLLERQLSVRGRIQILRVSRSRRDYGPPASRYPTPLLSRDKQGSQATVGANGRTSELFAKRGTNAGVTFNWIFASCFLLFDEWQRTGRGLCTSTLYRQILRRTLRGPGVQVPARNCNARMCKRGADEVNSGSTIHRV